MKTIQEKAEAYDEVRKKIAIRFGSNVADEIFSEYEESEDEEVKKALIQNLKERFGTNGTMGGILDMPRVLAWFEKQGEKGTNGNDREIPFDAWSEEDEKMYTATIFALAGFIGNEDKLDWLKSIKDRVQPKQEWSEEDEEIKKKVMHSLSLDGRISNTELIDIYNWLKSLKDRVQLQPKQEWGEEDESRMDNLCHFLEEYGNQYYGHLTLQGTISWLKSLKPQPKQEWSEEDEEMIGGIEKK